MQKISQSAAGYGSILAWQAAKKAVELTLYGGAITGGIVGAVFSTFLVFINETSFDKIEGLVMAVPAGLIFGAMTGLFLGLLLIYFNYIVVYAVTWLVMNNNWPIVVYRWLLIILMTMTDVGLILYLWYSTKENTVGNGFNNFLLLIAVAVGIAAIIASVLMSRWYSKMVASIHRDDDIVALGYNPEIYK